MVEEKTVSPLSGWIALPAFLLLIALSLLPIVTLNVVFILIGVVAFFLLLVFGMPGFFTVQPNDARVLLLFGNYVGSVRTSGFHWVNPFYSKNFMSLRVRNFQTARERFPRSMIGMEIQ